MDKHREYVISLSVSTLLGMTALVAGGEERIGVYLSVFAICYFASTEIFRPRRRWIDAVGILLFVAFMILVIQKAAEVLGYGPW